MGIETEYKSPDKEAEAQIEVPENLADALGQEEGFLSELTNKKFKKFTKALLFTTALSCFAPAFEAQAGDRHKSFGPPPGSPPLSHHMKIPHDRKPNLGAFAFGIAAGAVAERLSNPNMPSPPPRPG